MELRIIEFNKKHFMAFSTAEHPIVVIGAGIGGLSAAIRLAAQGHAVHVYEQQSYVGGKMNELRADGFRGHGAIGDHHAACL